MDKVKLVDNKSYEIVANSLIKAIDITCESWIKENWDLYYKISFNDNNNLIYSENDYIYVTLIDLFLAQEKLVGLYGESNDSIERLILSKMKYLDTQNFGLTDDNPKLPPNEDISSRLMAQKLALKLGYI